MQSNFGPIMQNAFVVPDLGAAIDHWVRVMNVGPFFMFEHIPFAELWYRGAPARVDLSCAIAYHGDLQIELIRQQDDAPSIYTDFERTHGHGLQHMGVMTDSLDADLARLAAQGIEPVQHGRTRGGGRFAYVSTDFHPGGMIELIESGPAMLAAFSAMHDAARDWDGAKPVRRFGEI